LLLAVFAPALPAAELTMLDGKKFTGDIVAVSPMEVTFKPTGLRRSTPSRPSTGITLGPAPKPVAAGRAFVAVELVDGTSFSLLGLRPISVNSTLTLP